MLAHSYLNGDSVEWEFVAREEGQTATERAQALRHASVTLARGIAIPLHAISSKLGMPPILCHAHTDLWNWKLAAGSSPSGSDSDKKISLDNLEQIFSMTGTATEKYFHLMITAYARRCGRPIYPPHILRR